MTVSAMTWLGLAASCVMLPRPQYVQRWQIIGAVKDVPQAGQASRSQQTLAEKSPIIRMVKTAAGRFSSQSISPAQCLANAAAMDLLAACLRMGLPISAGLRAVAPLSDAASEPLMLVARSVELGADSPTCWAPVAELSGWSAVGKLAQRSAQSGAALAQGIGDIATGQRAAAGDAAEASAERAGVLIAGPLALCFLPAFVILGLIPAVIGLAGAMELGW